MKYIPDFQADKSKTMKQLCCVSFLCIIFVAMEVYGAYMSNSLAVVTDVNIFFQILLKIIIFALNIFNFFLVIHKIFSFYSFKKLKFLIFHI